jgi:3-deoxy-D-manno-octulosonic-acid transferase
MAEIAATPLSARCRSAGDDITADTDIFVVDKIGEMGLWYRLADLAFLGGSLVAHGGQNPIEAAKLGVPILHGPHIGNFRDVYGALSQAGAAGLVHDGPSLAASARALLQDRGERQRMVREAHACVARLSGALDRTLEALDPYLAALRRAAA